MHAELRRRDRRPPARVGAVALAALVANGCGTEGLRYEGVTGEAVSVGVTLGLPSIAVAVDGAEPQPMVVDTGSPLTLLSLHAHPQRSAGTAAIDLEAFGLRFPALDAAAVELYAAGGPCVDDVPAGVVGMDILGHFRLAIDYRGGTMALYDGGTPPAPDGVGPAEETTLERLGGGTVAVTATESLRVGATRLVVEAIVEGRALSVLVDTGSSSTLMSDTLLRALDDREDRPLACCQTVATATQGLQYGLLTRIGSLRIGTTELADFPVLVLPAGGLFEALSSETRREIAMVLGSDFLQRFASDLDIAAGIWRLSPFDDATEIDPQQFLLPGFTFCSAREPSDGVIVIDVFEESDAAAQGVQSGDRVVAIAGEDITGWSEAQVLALLRAYAAETPLEMIFRAEGGGTRDRTILLQQLLPTRS